MATRRFLFVNNTLGKTWTGTEKDVLAVLEDDVEEAKSFVKDCAVGDSFIAAIFRRRMGTPADWDTFNLEIIALSGNQTWPRGAKPT